MDTYEQNYYMYNSVNLPLVDKEDIEIFGGNEKPFKLNMTNILQKYTEIDRTKDRVIFMCKIYDYILRNHISYLTMLKISTKFENAVYDKLKEFSKHSQFGTFRAKYYARHLFPDGKCEHHCVNYRYMYYLCPNKKKHNTPYCHAHSQTYCDSIRQHTLLIEPIAMLIMQY